ncbi:MAG: hypothetical protein AAF206_07565 [Bacteroidota bacterium]
MKKRCWIWIIGLCSLVACEFDGDLRYQVRTQRGFFWSQADDGSRGIWVWQAGNLMPQAEAAWGVAAEDVLSIDGREGELWIGLQNPNEAWQLDPLTDEVLQRIPLGDFQPHFLSIGESTLLLGDSSRQQIAFYDRSSESLVVDTIPGIPGQMAYRSQKYFVQTGPQQLTIYIESAFAPISEISLSHPIVDLVLDNGVQTIAITRTGDDFFQSAINYNTNRLQDEFSVRYRKLRPTPFDHQIYGREYLQNIQLNGQRLFPGDLQPVEDFEIDFFESQLFLIRNDSLIQRSLLSEEERYLQDFPDSLVQAWFFVGEVGE